MKNEIKREQLWIWAVDPLGEGNLQTKVAQAIRRLAAQTQARVQPVYVLPHPILRADGVFHPDVFNQLRLQAQDRMDKIVRKAGLRHMLPLAVLDVQETSLTAQARALISYAQDVKATMLLSGTRARRGPARWLLGSFAETLSLVSRIPLVLVNPQWRPKLHVSGVQRILFPTDFSDLSHRAFQEVLSFAKRRGARVHLYHRFGTPLTPGWDLTYGESAIFASREAEDRKAIELLARKWRKEGIDQGVRVSTEIDERYLGWVSDSILRSRKFAPDLIAMAAQSSRFEAAVMGSTTRQVIRRARVPVWILHPKARSSAAAREVTGRAPVAPRTGNHRSSDRTLLSY